MVQPHSVESSANIKWLSRLVILVWLATNHIYVLYIKYHWSEIINTYTKCLLSLTDCTNHLWFSFVYCIILYSTKIFKGKNFCSLFLICECFHKLFGEQYSLVQVIGHHCNTFSWMPMSWYHCESFVSRIFCILYSMLKFK